MRRQRQLPGGEHRFHHGLVHADRRREHPGADVGEVGQFEQPLDRAVFAAGAVQHGEDRVEMHPVNHRRIERRVVAAFQVRASPLDGQQRLVAARIGHQQGFPGISRLAGFLFPDVVPGVRLRLGRWRAIGYNPPALRKDVERDGVVPVAVEVGQH